MRKPLILTPQAQEDLDRAYEWYEQQYQGLGKEFIRCADARLSAISRNPLQYQVVYKNTVRRALINRFPFSIYFIDENEDVWVIAVLHQRGDPQSWKART